MHFYVHCLYFLVQSLRYFLISFLSKKCEDKVLKADPQPYFKEKIFRNKKVLDEMLI